MVIIHLNVLTPTFLDNLNDYVKCKKTFHKNSVIDKMYFLQLEKNSSWHY